MVKLAGTTFLMTLLAVTSIGCSRPDIVKLEWDPPTRHDVWSGKRAAPRDIQLPSGFLFTPLGPELAQLDYDAFMSSREHLQRTLHWGSWPSEDGTVEENRKDLERHWREFEKNEAYAYAVLTPDRGREVGCVYIKPLPEKGPYAMKLTYWMTEDQVAAQRDAVFLEDLLLWIESVWPIDEVVLRQHVENARGAEIALAAGMIESGAVNDDHRTFVWRRN